MSASGPSGPLVGLFESDHFTQVLLYSHPSYNEKGTALYLSVHLLGPIKK